MHHYLRLGAMLVLSFVVMYVLMYAMVNRFENVLNNVNQVYMAALMASPMALLEVALMGKMYPDRRVNIAIGAIAAVATVVFFLLIRQQAAVNDAQFLRSMIPHHAGAILMCEQAPIERAEIKELCGTIISSQQREIEQMRALLAKE